MPGNNRGVNVIKELASKGKAVETFRRTGLSHDGDDGVTAKARGDDSMII